MFFEIRMIELDSFDKLFGTLFYILFYMFSFCLASALKGIDRIRPVFAQTWEQAPELVSFSFDKRGKVL